MIRAASAGVLASPNQCLEREAVVHQQVDRSYQGQTALADCLHTFTVQQQWEHVTRPSPKSLPEKTFHHTCSCPDGDDARQVAPSRRNTHTVRLSTNSAAVPLQRVAPPAYNSVLYLLRPTTESIQIVGSDANVHCPRYCTQLEEKREHYVSMDVPTTCNRCCACHSGSYEQHHVCLDRVWSQIWPLLSESVAPVLSSCQCGLWNKWDGAAHSATSILHANHGGLSPATDRRGTKDKRRKNTGTTTQQCPKSEKTARRLVDSASQTNDPKPVSPPPDSHGEGESTDDLRQGPAAEMDANSARSSRTRVTVNGSSTRVSAMECPVTCPEKLGKPKSQRKTDNSNRPTSLSEKNATSEPAGAGMFLRGSSSVPSGNIASVLRAEKPSPHTQVKSPRQKEGATINAISSSMDNVSTLSRREKGVRDPTSLDTGELRAVIQRSEESPAKPLSVNANITVTFPSESSHAKRQQSFKHAQTSTEHETRNVQQLNGINHSGKRNSRQKRNYKVSGSSQSQSSASNASHQSSVKSNNETAMTRSENSTVKTPESSSSIIAATTSKVVNIPTSPGKKLTRVIKRVITRRCASSQTETSKRSRIADTANEAKEANAEDTEQVIQATATEDIAEQTQYIGECKLHPECLEFLEKWKKLQQPSVETNLPGTKCSGTEMCTTVESKIHKPNVDVDQDNTKRPTLNTSTLYLLMNMWSKAATNGDILRDSDNVGKADRSSNNNNKAKISSAMPTKKQLHYDHAELCDDHMSIGPQKSDLSLQKKYATDQDQIRMRITNEDKSRPRTNKESTSSYDSRGNDSSLSSSVTSLRLSTARCQITPVRSSELDGIVDDVALPDVLVKQCDKESLVNINLNARKKLYHVHLCSYSDSRKHIERLNGFVSLQQQVVVHSNEETVRHSSTGGQSLKEAHKNIGSPNRPKPKVENTRDESRLRKSKFDKQNDVDRKRLDDVCGTSSTVAKEFCAREFLASGGVIESKTTTWQEWSRDKNRHPTKPSSETPTSTFERIECPSTLNKPSNLLRHSNQSLRFPYISVPGNASMSACPTPEHRDIKTRKHGVGDQLQLIVSRMSAPSDEKLLVSEIISSILNNAETTQAEQKCAVEKTDGIQLRDTYSQTNEGLLTSGDFLCDSGGSTTFPERFAGLKKVLVGRSSQTDCMLTGVSSCLHEIKSQNGIWLGKAGQLAESAFLNDSGNADAIKKEALSPTLLELCDANGSDDVKARSVGLCSSHEMACSNHGVIGETTSFPQIESKECLVQSDMSEVTMDWHEKVVKYLKFVQVDDGAEENAVVYEPEIACVECMVAYSSVHERAMSRDSLSIDVSSFTREMIDMKRSVEMWDWEDIQTVAVPRSSGEMAAPSADADWRRSSPTRLQLIFVTVTTVILVSIMIIVLAFL